MALINTLRKRMGKIVVGVVAFSMVAFILADFLQSGSSLISDDNTVAEIAGTEITYPEFQQKVDELSYVFSINQNRNPLSEDMDMIREQAWNALIFEHVYENQFDELGLKVPETEAIDMVQGNNIAPAIKQSFTNPNTGQFQREAIINFLNTEVRNNPQQRAAWISFEKTLTPARLAKKYESLFEKTNYVTSAEAEKYYTSQASNISVEYFYVPFFSVSDSSVSVSEGEMEDYLEAHKDEYQREESRSISYVTFPIKPSAEDSAMVREEVEDLRAGLKSAQNDSTYASINSDGLEPFLVFNEPSQIPPALIDQPVGTVTEAVIVGDKYEFYKLSEYSKGEEQFANVSHILIQPPGQTDEQMEVARMRAEELIAQLQGGADFSTMAMMNSADQSNSQNGGDLGWVGEESSLVQPFKDAIFNFGKEGLIPEPVETQFGYHIIKINEPLTDLAIKVAKIEKEFFTSDETLNNIYRQADLLTVNSDGLESFENYAKAEGYAIKTAGGLTKNDERVGNITNARAVVLWLYNDASLDDVSEVFELNDTYMVAVMDGKQEKGTAKLSSVRNEIEGKVRNNKKASLIKDKIASIEGDDFDQMKEDYGDESRSGEADLTLSSNSFPGVGFAPEAVGVAFSLNEGELTRPFEIANGVLIVKAITKGLPDEIEDYGPYANQLRAQRSGSKEVIANFPLTFSPLLISDQLDAAVKDFAEITDKRYKFF